MNNQVAHVAHDELMKASDKLAEESRMIIDEMNAKGVRSVDWPDDVLERYGIIMKQRTQIDRMILGLDPQ